MIIETKNLTKQYSGKGGCKGISLSVSEGRTFGFLGPNGAGKSTFVKTLLGLLKPTSGEAYLLGKPIGDIKVREKVGYLPELFRYHDFLTGEQLLKYHAELYGLGKSEYLPKIGGLIDLVGLTGKSEQKVGTYSKGMQQRIGLAIALVNDPKLLFLDEPTSALDPLGRKEVRDLMLDLKSQGITIFLNSHLLSEVEAVCDDIAIINNSELVIQDSLAALTQKEVHLEITLKDQLLALKQALRSYCQEVVEQEKKLNITLKDEKEITQILKVIIEHQGEILDIATKKKSLEDLFLACTQKKGN
ncbi:ABC-2 type transport system ATP-binding protein [Desulfonispora thiosulfatigenes DSM 11270]|uniref:ABC-2 type transport system ATP-binding protein n=1 Tax=Desulfonispora thiosulfatigenes DSM 11270 TaxID=656914 RepID=A0A1W1V2B4_DESTI|nr:ABC transporter ATP-binding protein [Desulfonispora thiosulfatigenes]SMB87161.1 ABC-2 type transport system ATP-binding protein [Desulfonispora thiosulfatigenes DSM 11270]